MGLSDSMMIPVNQEVIFRIKETESQTKKTRFNRWQNMFEVFEVKNSMLLENKHVLLVDDVITTGATLESCIRALSSINGIQISIATIAMAHS